MKNCNFKRKNHLSTKYSYSTFSKIMYSQSKLVYSAPARVDCGKLIGKHIVSKCHCPVKKGSLY